MADVGVLNLQIHSDSSQATESLKRLADALGAVKTAVNESQLSRTANALAKINNVVTVHTVTNMNGLANALRNIQAACNFTIPNLSGLNRVRQMMDSMSGGSGSTGGMRETTDAMTEGFMNVSQTIEEANRQMHDFNDTLRDTMQLMQNTNWGGGFEQFSQMLEMLFRAQSMSIGSGSPIKYLMDGSGGSGAPWQYWRNGAIPAEGWVGDSHSPLGIGGPQPENMLSTWVAPTDVIPVEGWVSGDAETAVENANDFADALENVRQVASDADSYNPAIEFAREWNNSSSGSAGATNGMAENFKEDIEWLNQLVTGASEIDLLNMRIDSMTDRLIEGATTGNMTGEQIASLVGRIQEARDRVEELTRAAEEQSTAAYKLASAWDAFKSGITKMFPTLAGLIKRFAQVAKYRVLRSIMKHISSGFSEGVENVYHYSKAVGTDLAPAMDQAATALQQMKNSIGAAMAPVIQALVPVLQTVVNAFINLVNYANQFFALINGQTTWTRALPETAEAYEKNSKAAKKASKAAKDLLADWDELNIIQRNSSSGGSTRSGKTAQEYSNMFEEVNEFDQKVKDVLSFIEDHLGGLKGLLTKLGAIILGWKLSRAFEGALHSIGNLIAGGALVVLGLEFSYGAGFNAGSKGYWDTGDIIKAVIGGIATAIGGSLIATGLGLSGVAGFGIGLTVAALVTLIGWVKGQQDLADKNKWGNLSWTQDQINQFVKDQFTFDVDAEIDVMNAHIRDTDAAKEKVRSAVSTFSASLGEAERIVADVDTTSATEKVVAVTKAATDAQAAIKAIQELIDTNEKGLTYTLTNFKFTDSEGNDITADLLSSIKVSDATLSEYFTGVGENLAKLILEGEKSGWKNGEMEAALELMASQKRIMQSAEEIGNKMSFESDIAGGLKGVIDRDTANAEYKRQMQKFDEYRQTVADSVEKEKEQLYYFAGLASAAALEEGLDTEQGQKLQQASDEFKAAADAIANDVEGAVEDRLKETKAVMASEWRDVLQKVYGEDMMKAADDVFDDNGSWFDFIDRLFGVSHATDARIERMLNEFGIDETVNSLLESLKTSLKNTDPNGIMGFLFDTLHMPVWNVLTDDMIEAIASDLKKNTGNIETARSLFMAMFNVDESTAMAYIKDTQDKVAEQAKENPMSWMDLLGLSYRAPDEMVNVPVEVTPEIVNTQGLKEEIEKAMEDGIMSTEESLNLMLKYGANEYSDAMEELYYNLDEEGRNRGGIIKPLATLASSSGLRMTGGHGGNLDTSSSTDPIRTTPASNTDEINNTATGVSRGNADVVSVLNQILSVARAISANNANNRKTYAPSSSTGALNAASAILLAKVTGNNP